MEKKPEITPEEFIEARIKDEVATNDMLMPDTVVWTEYMFRRDALEAIRLSRKESEEVIADQARIIYQLTKKNEDLQDTKNRREEWLRNAKEEAGYQYGESFDVVWKETLQKSREQEEKIKAIREEMLFQKHKGIDLSERQNGINFGIDVTLEILDKHLNKGE